ncbi:MAG: hypothetical protein AAFX01_14360 [Cyanobacteria bacterium J06638_28]
MKRYALLLALAMALPFTAVAMAQELSPIEYRAIEDLPPWPSETEIKGNPSATPQKSVSLISLNGDLSWLSSSLKFEINLVNLAIVTAVLFFLAHLLR